jgi:hypothetical protein
MWLCTPRMRLSNSARKPFMTDMTMISAATPIAMPARENAAMTETNPSSLRARRYRKATRRSNAEKIMRPAAAAPHRR